MDYENDDGTRLFLIHDDHTHHLGMDAWGVVEEEEGSNLFREVLHGNHRRAGEDDLGKNHRILYDDRNPRLGIVWDTCVEGDCEGNRQEREDLVFLENTDA